MVDRAGSLGAQRSRPGPGPGPGPAQLSHSGRGAIQSRMLEAVAVCPRHGEHRATRPCVRPGAALLWGRYGAAGRPRAPSAGRPGPSVRARTRGEGVRSPGV